MNPSGKPSADGLGRGGIHAFSNCATESWRRRRYRYRLLSGFRILRFSSTGTTRLKLNGPFLNFPNT